MCPICRAAEATSDSIGYLSVCSTCYGIFTNSKQNMRMAVAADFELESDQRLKEARAAILRLEAQIAELKKQIRRLQGLYD